MPSSDYFQIVAWLEATDAFVHAGEMMVFTERERRSRARYLHFQIASTSSGVFSCSHDSDTVRADRSFLLFDQTSLPCDYLSGNGGSE